MVKADSLSDRLNQQIQFIVEADKLKEIQRRTYLISGKRLENSAEHSWHLSLLVLVLQEYANELIDTLKVLRMVILHDLVEIDAGDVFLYDLSAVQSKQEAENRAADRLFGLLPEDQEIEFRSLWQEFEARQSPEARLAAALDRLIPLIHNLQTNGRTWKEHGIIADQVYSRNQMIAEGSRVLWDWAKRELDRAMETGGYTGRKGVVFQQALGVDGRRKPFSADVGAPCHWAAIKRNSLGIGRNPIDLSSSQVADAEVDELNFKIHRDDLGLEIAFRL